MNLRKTLGLSNWNEFYTLKPLYKWLFYAFGWLMTIGSLLLIIITIFLYTQRNKTTRKQEDKIQFTYQKIPYWLGWFSCPLIIVVMLGFILAFI